MCLGFFCACVCFVGLVFFKSHRYLEEPLEILNCGPEFLPQTASTLKMGFTCPYLYSSWASTPSQMAAFPLTGEWVAHFQKPIHSNLVKLPFLG